MLHHWHLLNVFDHFPQREEGFGLASRLHRNGCLNRNRDLLAGQMLYGRCHHRNGNNGSMQNRHGYRASVLLWDELVAVIHGLLLLLTKLLRLVGLGNVLPRQVLLVCHEVFILIIVVKIVNGRHTRDERAFIGRSRNRREGRVAVIVVDYGVLVGNVLVLGSGGCRQSHGGHCWHGELGTSKDPVTQLRESHPVLGVGVEDAAQNVIELISQRKDGLKKVLGANICAVGGVLKGSLLPWVASASQVN